MVKTKKSQATETEIRVNVLENAVLMTLRFFAPGNHGRVDSKKVDTNADKNLLHVSKALLDSEEYRAIMNHRWAWRHRYLGSRALPSLLYGTATYVLPLALLSEVERKCDEYAQEDRRLVDVFCEAYPERVLEAKSRLRDEFNQEDYPPVETVRAAFRFKKSYMTVGTPESLANVDAALYARERSNFYESLVETASEIRGVLREGLAELVEWMVGRLEDGGDGKEKIFGKPFDTRLEKMRDFLSTFEARNLTDDSELGLLVDKAQALLRGVNAETVKGEDFRKRVRDGFSAVKSKLNSMVEAKPSRRIVLED